MNRDIEYEKNNIGYDEQYPKEEGGGIKCKNYEVCDTILPKYWFELKGEYICTNCDMMFGGILNIKKDLDECPICLILTKQITLFNCNHSICIDCFKRCYYGDDNSEDEPKFPYPEIEDEYHEDDENPKWEKDYPLIKKYYEAYKIWEEENEIKYENEEHLRKCPLCRK